MGRCGIIRVLIRVDLMSFCDMGVMGRLFMMAGSVVFRGMLMMLGGLFVMLSGLLVRVRSFLRH